MLQASEEETEVTVSEQLINTLKKTTFEEQMKEYVDYQLMKEELPEKGMFYIDQMDRTDEKFAIYYNRLGAERIKALQYKEKRLREELNNQQWLPQVAELVKAKHPVGTTMKASQWKQSLGEIYANLGISKAPKMKDLETVFGFKMKRVNVINEYRIEYDTT